MVDEEVQEEQENVEMKAAETENGDSPDDDMDSLMNELEQQKTSPEGTVGSGDLSSLITEKADSTEKISTKCLIQLQTPPRPWMIHRLKKVLTWNFYRKCL